MPLTKPVIRYIDNNMQQQLALSARFSATNYYSNMAKEYKVAPQNQHEVGVFHKIFQKLNDLAGDVLGLQQWAHVEVHDILNQIQQVANKKGTTLILLGPPFYPYNPRISSSCATLNQKIARFSAANNSSHIDMVTPAINNSWLFSNPDGRHINEAGHAFMAKGILANLQVPNKALGSLVSQ